MRKVSLVFNKNAEKLILKKGLKGLKEKIIYGKFPSIPEIYSKDLSDLLKKILEIEPEKRLSIEEILDMQIIKKNITKIIEKIMDDLKEFAVRPKKNEICMNYCEIDKFLKGENGINLSLTPEKLEIFKIFLEHKTGSSDNFLQLYNFIKVKKKIYYVSLLI